MVPGRAGERRDASILSREEVIIDARGPAEERVIVGVGIDLIEQERVARALERWGERLVRKLMGSEEAARLPSGPARARAVALAIAAKEAASKALGTGWSRGVGWRDVVVSLGPPVSVALEGGALARARRLGSAGRTHASLEVRGDLVIGQVRLLS
jgi:holo-[acyl-carrier protein] synthase